MLKNELVIALERYGMKFSKGTTRIKFQKLLDDRGIAISYLVDRIIEGWVGKLKGSFQMLYERGQIDPSNPSKCKDKGIKDAMGNLLEETCLKILLEK